MMRKSAAKVQTKKSTTPATWKPNSKQRKELTCTRSAKEGSRVCDSRSNPGSKKDSNKPKRTRRSLPSYRKRRGASKAHWHATMLIGRRKWQQKKKSIRNWVKGIQNSSRCLRWAPWQINGYTTTKSCARLVPISTWNLPYTSGGTLPKMWKSKRACWGTSSRLRGLSSEGRQQTRTSVLLQLLGLRQLLWWMKSQAHLQTTPWPTHLWQAAHCLQQTNTETTRIWRD